MSKVKVTAAFSESQLCPIPIDTTVYLFQIAPSVSEFYTISHLCWAVGGAATSSIPHVLYMGISYSYWKADGMLNSTQSILHKLCRGTSYMRGTNIL